MQVIPLSGLAGSSSPFAAVNNSMRFLENSENTQHRSLMNQSTKAPVLRTPGENEDDKANCATISGLPWFLTELELKNFLSTHFAAPIVLRLYEDPLNGRSRGICLVLFDEATSDQDHDILSRFQTSLEMVGPYPVTVSLWHISTRWNPLAPLPPIPGDPFRSLLQPARVSANRGFGPSGIAVRGISLGEANTASAEGMMALTQAKKRYRTAIGAEHTPETKQCEQAVLSAPQIFPR